MNSNPDSQLAICDLAFLNLSFLTVNKQMNTNGFICRMNEITNQLLPVPDLSTKNGGDYNIV